MGNEACMTPPLGLIGVDRQHLVMASPRMADMVDAAAHCPARPGVEEVDGQGRMDADGRMQAGGWLPGPVADPADDTPGSRSSAAGGRGDRCR